MSNGSLAPLYYYQWQVYNSQQHLQAQDWQQQLADFYMRMVIRLVVQVEEVLEFSSMTQQFLLYLYFQQLLESILYKGTWKLMDSFEKGNENDLKKDLNFKIFQIIQDLHVQQISQIIMRYSTLNLILILVASCFSFQLHPISRNKAVLNSQHNLSDQFSNATATRSTNSFVLNLQSRSVKLINVPDVMQATDYTCGPSSLSAVLNYYQLVYRQSELAKLAKTQQEYGTGPRNLANAVRQLNITAQLRENMTLSDLQNLLSAGRPVIVEIQAWSDDEDPKYDTDFDDGHYVVAIGFDSTYFYFEDPWIMGSIGYIAKKQFMSRWHDYVHSENRNVFNIGIIVGAPKKDTPVVIKLE